MNIKTFMILLLTLNMMCPLASIIPENYAKTTTMEAPDYMAAIDACDGDIDEDYEYTDTFDQPEISIQYMEPLEPMGSTSTSYWKNALHQNWSEIVMEFFVFVLAVSPLLLFGDYVIHIVFTIYRHGSKTYNNFRVIYSVILFSNLLVLLLVHYLHAAEKRRSA